MKVLVLWASNANPNLGVRVLAEGMAAFAKRAWGSSARTVFADFTAKPGQIGMGVRAVLRDVGRTRGPIKTLVREVDVVLDSGAGDSFTDIYGLKRLLVLWYTQRVAVRMGRPLILGPQTVGPFNTRLGRWLARSTLKNAAAVFVRDSVSQGACEKLGRSPDSVATDVVFALPPVARDKTRVVALNVSGLLWHSNPHVDSARYQEETRRFLCEAEAAGVPVSLVAHVVGPESRLDETDAFDNDVPVLRALKSEFPSVEVLTPGGLEDVRSIFASAELVVGARMHACLNALSVGTPAFALAYSRKFEPLLKDLGWEHVIDMRQPFSMRPVLDALADEQALARMTTTAGMLERQAVLKLDRALEVLSRLEVVP